MAADILQTPEFTRPFVDRLGFLTQESRDWVQIINQRSLIVGPGTPEGIVEADIGSEYMDTLGVPGAIKYIKRDADDGLGDRRQGWVLI